MNKHSCSDSFRDPNMAPLKSMVCMFSMHGYSWLGQRKKFVGCKIPLDIHFWDSFVESVQQPLIPVGFLEMAEELVDVSALNLCCVSVLYLYVLHVICLLSTLGNSI